MFCSKANILVVDAPVKETKFTAYCFFMQTGCYRVFCCFAFFGNYINNTGQRIGSIYHTHRAFNNFNPLNGININLIDINFVRCSLPSCHGQAIH